MQDQQKTGKGHCPHCKDGFVIKEPQMMSAPPGFHCVICGWHRWLGFEIRQPDKKESVDSYRASEPQKKSHKKAQKELKRAMGRLA